MRTDKKKEARDKARIEEHNSFVMSEDDSYEDVDNETKLNFVVNKIDHVTEKRKREVTEKNKKDRKKILGNKNVARAEGKENNGLVPEGEHNAPIDISNN